MNIVNKILNKMFGLSDKQYREHHVKFILPHWHTLIFLNATKEEINYLTNIAYQRANYSSTFPGTTLRDLIKNITTRKELDRLLNDLKQTNGEV